MFIHIFSCSIWSKSLVHLYTLLAKFIHIHVLGYLEINTLISTILTHQSSTLFSIVYYISSLLMTFDVVFLTICFTNFNSFNVLFWYRFSRICLQIWSHLILFFCCYFTGVLMVTMLQYLPMDRWDIVRNTYWVSHY